ncbi:MAG: hypothetical protein MI723_00070 [Caulobacterales bacterium]|nr:hypothetical protein [Caulobacterales bacterium]
MPTLRSAPTLGHSADRPLSERAIAILKANDRGGYTVPTKGLYPHQWNWDSAFVALGFRTFDEDRAWREIETLFEAQWEDGLAPHIVFRSDDPDYFPGPGDWGVTRAPATSGISQPPVATSVVRWLWESCADREAFRPRLRALYPKLLAWHAWFKTYRDPTDSGVILAVHPWETGRDHSAEWIAPSSAIDVSNVGAYRRRDTSFVEGAMRPTQHEYDQYMAIVGYGRDCGWDHAKIARSGPFQVFDPGLTFIFLRAERDLLALAGELGDRAGADAIGARIDRAERGVDHLWDDEAGVFCARDRKTGRHSGMVTSASFLAFYADAGSDARRGRLIEHLERIESRVQFLLPSLDPDRREFDHVRYWLGPVWAVVNQIVAIGLEERDHADWADRLRRDTRSLARHAGFCEAYSAIDGQRAGGDDFSWTAATWLAWAADEATSP